LSELSELSESNESSELSVYKLIGYKKENGSYSINKKEYEFEYPFFKSKEQQQCSKRILIDLRGEEVGYSKIKLLKNKKLYHNKNLLYDNELIYTIHDNEEITLIGQVEYVYNDMYNKNVGDGISLCKPVKIIYYTSMPIIYKENDIRMTIDVNCINISFKLNYDLNTQRLYDVLIKQDYMCYYKPMEYRGLKFIYKYPRDNIDNTNNTDNTDELYYDAKCKCKHKCTCYNLTYILFQNGSVIASGFKTQEHIDKSIDVFYHILENHKDIIKRKNIALT
jgi:TATA-box binding protein (TBP) (component of TFIID and TFIIIB)